MIQKAEMSSRMSIDIETRSEASLKTAGVYNYAIHPTTEILCIAFKVDDGPTQCITPITGDVLTKRDFSSKSPSYVITMTFVKLFLDPNCTLFAFNETFERLLLTYCAGPKLGFPSIKFTRWQCTQAQSLYYNLPNDLDTVSRVLPIEHKKMKDGHIVMLQLCKQRNYI